MDDKKIVYLVSNLPAGRNMCYLRFEDKDKDFKLVLEDPQGQGLSSRATTVQHP